MSTATGLDFERVQASALGTVYDDALARYTAEAIEANAGLIEHYASSVGAAIERARAVLSSSG